jgi:Sulfotransferase family
MTMDQDPHEPQLRTDRFAKNGLDERFLQALNEVVSKAVFPGSPNVRSSTELPIIYLVGLPRSGTTLLSQLVSRRLEVGYINNLIARFWLRPSVGIRLSRALLGGHRRDAIELASTYGVTSDVVGPHEFGYFWRHWLNLDAQPTHNLTPAAEQLVDKSGLRNALERELLAEFNMPVVFKNVICGFHASLLTGLHSRSLFVMIRRNLHDVAASILHARQQRYGDYRVWWSLKPSTYETISQIDNPGRQVAGQVKDCLAEMMAELARPMVNTIYVEYEDLCLEPNMVLESISAKLAAMGTPLALTSKLSSVLTPSRPAPLPVEIEKSLTAALAERG